jgi:hypothetical protein
MKTEEQTSVLLEWMGFRRKPDPIVVREERDRARGAVSPLGGEAKWPQPAAPGGRK